VSNGAGRTEDQTATTTLVRIHCYGPARFCRPETRSGDLDLGVVVGQTNSTAHRSTTLCLTLPLSCPVAHTPDEAGLDSTNIFSWSVPDRLRLDLRNLEVLQFPISLDFTTE